MLHGDPVDSASSGSGRKSESGGGRRSKRGKRAAREPEVQVAKVPAHSPGEHPMFKAMAAANGKHDDEDDDAPDAGDAEEVAELEADSIRRAVSGTPEDDEYDEDSDEDTDEDDDEDSDEDTDEDDDTDEDSDDHDTDDDDTDELDLDSDDEDEDEDDLDDDLDLINRSAPSRDAGETVSVAAPGRRPRRRAAARPAGPPSTD